MRVAEPASSPKNSNNDTLKVLLFTHHSDYFIFRGVPMGFQYEMLNILADSLGKTLDLHLENDPKSAFSAVFSHCYDIVAMDFKKMPMMRQLTSSLPFASSHPVLLERKKTTERNIVPTIYVPAFFPASISLDSLSDEVDWELAYSSTLLTEDLFQLLENQKIDYIVSDYHTASTLLPFYPNLKISCSVGGTFPRSWSLNGRNKALNARINSWLERFLKTKKYRSLSQKYISQYAVYQSVMIKNGGRRQISPYDQTVKRYAKKRGIDWRFVVSIMYQESRFHVEASGLGGSFGLMQMMPATAERYGITPESSAEAQIAAGVQHIAIIRDLFSDVTDDEEALKFVCAGYNAGSGHIKDAQRLCEKFGGTPTDWNSVSKYLLLKSDREFYTDPVVQCGYYPGKHTVNYVEEVMARYYLFRKS